MAEALRVDGLAGARSTTQVLGEVFDATDDSRSVPTAPGLSVTVDGDAVERYRGDRR